MNGQSSLQPVSSLSSGTSSQDSWVDSHGTMHQWCKVFIFVGKDFLGEFLYDPGEHPEMHWKRDSTAYFCGECGEVWARLVIVATGRPQFFEVERVACEKHRDPWHIAGSLLAGRLDGFLDLLPAAALRRELLIHLRQGERV